MFSHRDRNKQEAEASSRVSVDDGSGQGATIRFDGALDYAHAADLRQQVRELLRDRRGQAVILDFDRVTAIDTTGLALINELRSLGNGLDISLEMRNVPRAASMFLSMAQERHRETGAQRETLSRISRIGDSVLQVLRSMRHFTTFVGDCLLALFLSMVRPRRWRVAELMYQIERTGSDAMLLVAGLTFLTGIIMALQTASSFGSMIAPVYVADTVTLFTTKRMAPLLTAIIAAGRSGTGFASELGTMRVTNQIDALTVLGIDVTEFLVLPRIMALMVATPILIMIGNVAGIIGGALVGKWVMHVSYVSYFNEVRQGLAMTAIASGLLKGVVFGGIIGLIGCYRGLLVEHEAESVGTQTTAAVVNSLLAIMIVDAIFASIFSLHGW